MKYTIADKFLNDSYLLSATSTDITPVAGVFAQTDHDGITKIKNSNSTFQNVDITNDPAANYTHDLIINGTISIKIKGNGGQPVSLESTVLTAPQLATVATLITGNMDSVNGYNINEYQIIYKLIIWGYINQTYTKTIKPYVNFNGVQSTNDSTTELTYKIPTTTITANKAAVTMTTNPLAILWSDGTATDAGGTEAARSGAGLGNIYLFGNYTKLIAKTQSISNIDVLNENLTYLSLDNNYSLNIQNSHFTNVNTALERISLQNCTDSKVDTVLSKYSGSLNYLNLGSTVSVLNSVDIFTLLTVLNLSNTTSSINNVELNTLLTVLNLSNTPSSINNVELNTLLTFLNLSNTPSSINNIQLNTLLKEVYIYSSNCIINDITNNTELLIFSASATNSSINDITNNSKLIRLNIDNTNSTINNVLNCINIIFLSLINTNSVINDVSTNTKLIQISVNNTNNTASDTNAILQDLIDTPRTGTKQLTYTDLPGIDPLKVEALEIAGWEITATPA